MNLELTWSVSGITTVDVGSKELHRAVNDGVDIDDGNALFKWILKSDPGLIHRLPENFDEMERPTVIEAWVYGDYPDWYYEDSE